MGSSKLVWAILKTNLVSTKNREFSVLLAYYVILFNLIIICILFNIFCLVFIPTNFINHESIP